MEPLKPSVKKKILSDNPQAAPEEIEEYERLLSQRFTKDPDLQPAPKGVVAADNSESRLKELHRKLFPEEYENDNTPNP